MKVSKKNILFFILGLLTYFVIDIATDWESHKNAFIEGYNEGRETAK